MHTFRAISCSSSGGQIVLMQHLVSSLLVSGHPVHSTGRSLTEIDDHFNTFMIIIYMYTFRAISCSSSGGQIVLMQQVVSSLSVSDHPVHSTGRSLTETDDHFNTFMIILYMYTFRAISCSSSGGQIVLMQHVVSSLSLTETDEHFNTFMIILYMYTFRAISCSSSGGQIVLMQHVVSSLSVSDHPVHSTGRSLTETDDHFNTFMIILYMYTFRAISCSSSGGQIVLMQHVVSSLSVRDHPVHSTGRSLTDSDDTRCCINTI